MVIFQFALVCQRVYIEYIYIHIYIYVLYIYIYIYICIIYIYLCIYKCYWVSAIPQERGWSYSVCHEAFFGISKRNAAAGCATSSVRFVAKAMSSRIERSNSKQTPQRNHEFYRNFMVQTHAFLSFLQIFCQIIPFFTSPAPTNPWVCRRFPVAVLLQHFNLGALAYVDSYQLQLFLGTYDDMNIYIYIYNIHILPSGSTWYNIYIYNISFNILPSGS